MRSPSASFYGISVAATSRNWQIGHRGKLSFNTVYVECYRLSKKSLRAADKSAPNTKVWCQVLNVSDASLSAHSHGSSRRCWPADLAPPSNTRGVTFHHRGWRMRAETVRLHSHHTMKVRRVKIPSTCCKRLQGRPPVYRELLPNGAMKAHPVHLSEGSSSRDLRRAETLLSARVERLLYFQEGCLPNCLGSDR